MSSEELASKVGGRVGGWECWEWLRPAAAHGRTRKPAQRSKAGPWRERSSTSAPVRAAPVPALQDLQQWRRKVRLESLKNAVLPPDLAARVSTTAAIELKKEL